MWWHRCGGWDDVVVEVQDSFIWTDFFFFSKAGSKTTSESEDREGVRGLRGNRYKNHHLGLYENMVT